MLLMMKFDIQKQQSQTLCVIFLFVFVVKQSFELTCNTEFE